MKNKKFLTLVLALVMVLGSFTSVFAAATTTSTTTEEVKKVTGRDNKIQYLVDNKYVEGRKVNEDPKNNDLALDKNLKRSEITKLLVYAIGRQDLAEKVQGAMKVYSDVETTHWANGVITVGTTMASPANAVAMLNGYPDGTFKPERDVTYAELAKMLVVLVKKDLTPEMAKNAIWASSWLTWAAELGILEDVVITDSNKAVTRADAFVMMYNALYTLKYVKKVPSNETMGILSQLSSNKLTLNQGDRQKTFTITNDTTFVLYNQYNQLQVNADLVSQVKNNFAAAVKVSAINNPSYYYGSLVRVLADANGNVTHILELGNPRYLALGNSTADQGNIIDPNARWTGVAKATVETSRITDLIPVNDNNYRGKATAAKINYVGGDAKSMDFVTGNLSSAANATLKEGKFYEKDANNFNILDQEELVRSVNLTKSTRYFVADVAANQLTEVADVDAAIRILGLTRASNWFFDVYVGYDKVGADKDYINSNPTNAINEAKVVVFNSVQKDNNDGTLYRVKNEATTAYNATLEDVTGAETVINVGDVRWSFPFNFNDAKLDVVAYYNNNAGGRGFVTKIDHSDTAKYPIVKVTSVDGRKIVVTDVYGDTAQLTLNTDYDKFLTKDALENAVIQFRTTTNNDGKSNLVDIVSVLTKYNIALKGSLNVVAGFNQGNQRYGEVVLAAKDVANGLYRVTIDNQRNLYDEDERFARQEFKVTIPEAEALIAAGIPVYARYKVEKDYDSTWRAYDFEIKVGNDWVRVINLPAKGLPAIVDGVRKLTIPDDVKANNYLDVEKDVKKLEDAVDALSYEDKAKWESDEYKAHRDQLAAVKAKVEAYKTAKTELDAELAKLLDNDAIKDVNKADLSPAAVESAAKTQVEGKIDAAKATVKTFALTNKPADNANYAAGAELKATVTLAHVNLPDLVSAPKALVGNIMN